MTEAPTLSSFLLARYAEDEAAAKAVPQLEHNFDMGGKRQDEEFTFGRTLPSSADGMGNWSSHADSPTTRAHFSRHDPERVLADVEAKRRIVQLAVDNNEFPDPYETEKVWEVVLPLMALPYADHPDYREEWRP